MLFVGGNTPFSEMKYTKALKDLNNKIIECKFENNKWIFMRERTDKSYPNAYSTAIGNIINNISFSYYANWNSILAVCNSIQHPVTKNMLLDFVHKHRFFEH
jgi:mRNA-capping enzyme